MLSRKQVCSAYSVSPRGSIKSPGKFEGCPLYVPAFWDDVGAGYSDETIETLTGPVGIIFLTEDDRGEFPELGPYVALGLWKENDGSVHCEEFESTVDLDDYRSQREQECLDVNAKGA